MKKLINFQLISPPHLNVANWDLNGRSQANIWGGIEFWTSDMLLPMAFFCFFLDYQRSEAKKTSLMNLRWKCFRRGKRFDCPVDVRRQVGKVKLLMLICFWIPRYGLINRILLHIRPDKIPEQKKKMNNWLANIPLQVKNCWLRPCKRSEAGSVKKVGFVSNFCNFWTI